MINIYTDKEIKKIDSSCKIILKIFEKLNGFIKAGISTKDINTLVEDIILSNNAKPAFLGYRGFPAASCISVNEEVVHGIPGKKKIKEGDIVSVDIGVLKDGFFGDAARTFSVGKIGKDKKRLTEVTYKALENAVDTAVVNNTITDISAVIEDTVTEKQCQPVRDLVGHGIGRMLHEDPQIPNYRSKGPAHIIKNGMVIAVEPMVNLGTYEVITLTDNWTVVTKDKKASAHFEHTMAIINGKAEILV